MQVRCAFNTSAGPSAEGGHHWLELPLATYQSTLAWKLRPKKMSEQLLMRSSCSRGATMPSTRRRPCPALLKLWVGSMAENLEADEKRGRG